ncbi:hypothetical protein BDFB_012163 [Asbolus verrucosus]|uniref:Uncharacterized protein n=1 Tax=Asbolus verrucosus TaxID=1661398 RepID=A0A482VX41_ASBVE|nr:hypothetical protein BDFB_012163 [Asbolus verrucosus]
MWKSLCQKMLKTSWCRYFGRARTNYYYCVCYERIGFIYPSNAHPSQKTHVSATRKRRSYWLSYMIYMTYDLNCTPEVYSL